MDSRHVRHGTCEPNLPAHFPSFVRGMLASLATGGALVVPAFAQDAEPCPGNNPAPVPTAVAVTDVPIVVPSTTDDYFVLYVSHDLDADTTVELPVLVKRGTAGTTTLAENIEALPAARYRVEKYFIAEPADVDGDCTDDLTELDNLGSMSPVNAAPSIPLSDGVLAVLDRATFNSFSFVGSVRFFLIDIDTNSPRLYFINGDSHATHSSFLRAVGIDWYIPDRITVSGVVDYYPRLVGPDDSPGVYVYRVREYLPFSYQDIFYRLLAASMPLLENDLAYYISNYTLQYFQSDLPRYAASRISLLFAQDIAPESGFIPLNEAEGYGLLRVMELEDRPNPRDVVIYEAVPNELPRVAGIITTVPQTPLAHVNLRAIQDGVPNAYIRDGSDKANCCLRTTGQAVPGGVLTGYGVGNARGEQGAGVGNRCHLGLMLRGAVHRTADLTAVEGNTDLTADTAYLECRIDDNCHQRENHSKRHPTRPLHSPVIFLCL